VVTDLTQINLEDVLHQLLADVQNANIVLAQIAVAPTASTVKANTDDGVSALAGAQGVTIKVLPGLAQSLVDLGLDLPGVTQPLATIQVGASSASVVREPKLGTLVPTASTAKVLSIKLDDTLGILQQLTGTASNAINTLATGPLGCNASNPLAGVICIDLGTVKTDFTKAELQARNMDLGPDTVAREATAAQVRVLAAAGPALGGDVLGLKLADATAAVYATPDGPITTPTTPAPTPLPKTGGSVPVGLGLGLLGLAGISAALVRRSRTSAV
jgi:hypothetical protein